MSGMIRMLALLVAAALVGCGSTGGGSSTSATSGGVSEDVDTVTKGRTYVGGKVVVKAVDLGRITEASVDITIRNKTAEYLSDLSYEVTLYYPNMDPDPAKRSTNPFTVRTSNRKRLDLDAREEATIRVRKSDFDPSAKSGARFVQFRLRAGRPAATRLDETFVGDRIKVVGIKRDWWGKPPTVKFTILNTWDSPLRLQFKVLLVKDGKVVAETAWRRAPGLIQPGQRTVLQPDLTGKSVTGTLPALKVKRPRM